MPADETEAGDATVRSDTRSTAAAGDDTTGWLDDDAPRGPAAQPPPRTFRCGPYQIIREIGRGGMGTVFLAARVDEEFNRRVAIKILRGFASEEVLRRFRHERQILASLEHPNVARLMDGGSTESGEPYFVMDYVEGLPLDTYCDSHRLNVDERIRLFLQLCSAVQYVHRNLIVHRDLKPGNVLVTANGTVKLLDFGIAKILRDDMSLTLADATRARAMLMTPAYASPEQARGEPITTASDVYTLGIILYELLTGQRPYRTNTKSPVEMVRVICEEEPSRPSTLVTTLKADEQPSLAARQNETVEQISLKRSTTPEKLGIALRGDLDTVLLMAMRKEPQRRYLTVQAFAQDLEHYLNDYPVQAHADSWGYRTGKLIRRNKLLLGAIAMVFVALLLGLASTTFEWRKARREQALAESRFGDVRHLATRFLFDVDGSIKDLSGATRARTLIATTGTEYLDRLASQSRNDLSLQQDLAAGYLKIGDVEGNPYLANVGQTPAAVESYRKAQAIGQTLVARNPRDPHALEVLARSDMALATVLGFSGKVPEAYGDAQQGLALWQKLQALQPGDPQIALDLSSAWERLGDLAGGMDSINLGRGKEAASDYQAAFQALPSVAAGQALAAEVNKRRAILLWKNSLMLERSGRVAEGLTRTDEALALSSSLLQADPDNATLKRMRAACLSVRGIELQSLGQAQAALESYTEAAQIDDALLKADASDSRAREDMMVAEKNLGDLYFHTLFRWPEALHFYQAEHALLEQRLKEDPGNVTAQDRLAVNESYLASTFLYLNHPGEARAEATESLTLAHRLADRPAATYDELYNFAWLATTMEPTELQQPAAALPYALKAVQASGGRDPDALGVLADAYFETGDVQQAIATAQRGLALFPPDSPGQAIPQAERRFSAALQSYQQAQQRHAGGTGSTRN